MQLSMMIGFTLLSLAQLHAESGKHLFRHPRNSPMSATEELLWPQGTPEVKQITEKTTHRSESYLARWVTQVQHPTLSIYSAGVRSGAAVVICPGGGYSGLALDKEGHDIARWLNSLGIMGVVLKYRLSDYGHPAPRQDVQRAIRTIRQRAEALQIDPGRIGVMGFSAGGHLASTAGTHFQAGNPDAADPVNRVGSRPDFMILGYPVISFDPEIAHAGSRNSLLGTTASAVLDAEYSNETRVTPQTPPTFLFHSLDDSAVKLENSLRFYRALQGYEIPTQLEIFSAGGHGYGLGIGGGEVTAWPGRCASWLEKLRMTGKE